MYNFLLLVCNITVRKMALCGLNDRDSISLKSVEVFLNVVRKALVQTD